jgi:hypothetical protein
MPRGFEEDTQAALWAALTGDAAVTALVPAARIFDDPPQASDGSTGYPHIAVGEVVFAPMDTYGELGADFVARIHVRSRAAGRKEAKQIQAAVYARLHRTASFALTDHRLIDLQWQMSDVTRLADGTFHGVSEFRGLIEPL